MLSLNGNLIKGSDKLAIYRNVQLSFWTDNKVEDEFTPEDKYFYLYLLTNPQTNICGCYEVSYKQMCNQTGYNKDTIERLLNRFENIHNMIRYSKETKEILVLNWYKYNWSSSAKVITGIESVAKHIKCKAFKDYVYMILDAKKNGTDIDYEYTIETSVSDTDTDSDTVSDSDSITVKKNSRKKNSKIYYPNDEKLNQAFLDFVYMRKKIKKPMTDNAITRMMNKLGKLSGGDNDLAIKILNQSTDFCWQDVYALKTDSGGKRTGTGGIDWEHV